MISNRFNIPRGVVLAMMATTLAVAQAPDSKSNHPDIVVNVDSAPAISSIVVKKTPASDALNQAAKDMTSEQKSLDTAVTAAKSALDAAQKVTNDKLVAAGKVLNDKLKADRRYKDDVVLIEKLQLELNANGADAQNKFNVSSGPLSSKLIVDKTLVESLTPIVRKENELPATAAYDAATQTWK